MNSNKNDIIMKIISLQQGNSIDSTLIIYTDMNWSVCSIYLHKTFINRFYLKTC